jgi:hypothetical protein
MLPLAVYTGSVLGFSCPCDFQVDCLMKMYSYPSPSLPRSEYLDHIPGSEYGSHN